MVKVQEKENIKLRTCLWTLLAGAFLMIASKIGRWALWCNPPQWRLQKMAKKACCFTILATVVILFCVIPNIKHVIEISREIRAEKQEMLNQKNSFADLNQNFDFFDKKAYNFDREAVKEKFET
jgi:hypothetical protein